MGKDKADNKVRLIGLSSALSLIWLVLFLLDWLVYGSVSVFFNINYVLAAALASLAWRLYLTR